MSTDRDEDFVSWLDAMETEFGYSDYEVAKKGKFSHSALSRARTDGVPPGWAICVKIAPVFNVSPITVFRKANLLPPGPDDSINLEDWQFVLAQATPEEREETKEILTLKIDRRQKAEQSARAAKFKDRKVKK